MFLGLLFFVCVFVVFLLGVVWFLSCFAFAPMHAFDLSLTGAQRTDSSPASKKTKGEGQTLRRLL